MEKDTLGLIRYYLTSPYPCAYLPDRHARSQVATPTTLLTTASYSELMRHGFRRSGELVYRPHCDTCRACVPVRIPINSFQPDRTQRRALRRHGQLMPVMRGLQFFDDHFELYQRYQSTRHPGGGMDGDNREQFERFLLHSTLTTRLVEFREILPSGPVLRMVSVIDQLDDGLSSVYTFFDPSDERASYGTFSILWQIETCRQLRLPYLYLGYWIRDCQKMTYKQRFHPLEGFIDQRWRLLTDDDFLQLGG